MKHWNELTELETEIIKVSEFKNLFKLLVAGTENYVDIKVLQSAIYTMETMIDDIDSKLYDKFQTVFDAVRDEDTEPEEEYRFENGQPFITISKKKHKAVNESTTSLEEDEAFKDLEKAIKNWHKATP
jgi:hypothetical protein